LRMRDGSEGSVVKVSVERNDWLAL
jgi:hypothetical protein